MCDSRIACSKSDTHVTVNALLISLELQKQQVDLMTTHPRGAIMEAYDWWSLFSARLTAVECTTEPRIAASCIEFLVSEIGSGVSSVSAVCHFVISWTSYRFRTPSSRCGNRQQLFDHVSFFSKSKTSVIGFTLSLDYTACQCFNDVERCDDCRLNSSRNENICKFVNFAISLAWGRTRARVEKIYVFSFRPVTSRFTKLISLNRAISSSHSIFFCFAAVICRNTCTLYIDCI